MIWLGIFYKRKGVIVPVNYEGIIDAYLRKHMEQDDRDDWWSDFLKQHKLENKVKDLDTYDKSVGNEPKTKRICLEVYSKYDEIKQLLEETKQQLLNDFGEIEQVHLQSGRVKSKNSLIEKIIRKRHEYIASQTSDYARLNSENYVDVITDLVGIRLIVNYRGKWQDIHKIILDHFPLKELNSYENIDHLPHIEGEDFLAQIPIAYYAYGDDIQQYIDANIQAKQHKQGYRSIHYVISYNKCYIELQVRTIYDEAWSDCDHNYVYKHEANPSNRALQELSHILCEITNVANDIGDNMHDIFMQEKLTKADGSAWIATGEDINFFREMIEKLHEAELELCKFSEKLVLEN